MSGDDDDLAKYQALEAEVASYPENELGVSYEPEHA
jgi:hypothetical protein